MSYDNPRLKLEMTFLDIIMAFSEGNPGAATVLMTLMENNQRIDPNDAFQRLGPFIGLDNLDCYGSNIWVFFKHLCGGDPVKMLGIMRAIQLGYTSDETVMRAIEAAKTGKPDLDIDGLLKQVRQRLPRFGQEPQTATEAVRESLQDSEDNRASAHR